jgi:hypothetical protein
MLITMFIGVMGHGFGLLGCGEWVRDTRIIGFGHPGRLWDVSSYIVQYVRVGRFRGSILPWI